MSPVTWLRTCWVQTTWVAAVPRSVPSRRRTWRISTAKSPAVRKSWSRLTPTPSSAHTSSSICPTWPPYITSTWCKVCTPVVPQHIHTPDCWTHRVKSCYVDVPQVLLFINTSTQATRWRTLIWTTCARKETLSCGTWCRTRTRWDSGAESRRANRNRM